jgi:glycosyl transferase, family 25
MLFLINLDDAVDRRAFMKSQLAAHSLQYTRVGIDMRKRSAAFITDWAASHFPQFRFDLDRLSGAEVGCWLSHLSAWKSMLARPDTSCCVVIEDDVNLGPDFGDALAALAASTAHDVIYLGTSSHNLSTRRRTRIGRFWAHGPVGAVYNTWAYSISRDYARRAFEGGTMRIDVPIDHFLGGRSSPISARIAVLHPAIVRENVHHGRTSQIGPYTRRLDRWRPVEAVRRWLLSSRISRAYYRLYRFL